MNKSVVAATFHNHPKPQVHNQSASATALRFALSRSSICFSASHWAAPGSNDSSDPATHRAWRPASPKGFALRSRNVRVLFCGIALAKACDVQNVKSNWNLYWKSWIAFWGSKAPGLNTDVTNLISSEVENSECGVHLQHLSQCLPKKAIWQSKWRKKKKGLKTSDSNFITPEVDRGDDGVVLQGFRHGLRPPPAVLFPNEAPLRTKASTSAAPKPLPQRSSTVGRMFCFRCSARASFWASRAEEGKRSVGDFLQGQGTDICIELIIVNKKNNLIEPTNPNAVTLCRRECTETSAEMEILVFSLWRWLARSHSC